mgnify:CR=1 FL=1
MGIQFNQIDNLQSTFDAVSGGLQNQITPLTGDIYNIISGDIGFEGHKFFNGNVDVSGSQGVYVNPNNIYTPNTVFAGSLKIGGGIASPRTTTTAPVGSFQVTGGGAFFDGGLTMRNNSTLTALTITGGSGEFHRGYLGEITTSGLVVSGATNTVVNLRELPYESGTLPSGSIFRSGNHIMIV